MGVVVMVTADLLLGPLPEPVPLMIAPVVASKTVPGATVRTGWKRFRFIGTFGAKSNAPPAMAALASGSFFWEKLATLKANNKQASAKNRAVKLIGHPPEKAG
jgi:hypothetical protein